MSRGAWPFFVTLEAPDSGTGAGRRIVEDRLVFGPDRLGPMPLFVLLAGELLELEPVLAARSRLLAPLGDRARVHDDLAALVHDVTKAAHAGDHIVVMSNGGFGGVHAKLLDALERSATASDERATQRLPM